MKVVKLQPKQSTATAHLLHSTYYPSLAEAKKELRSTTRDKRWYVAIDQGVVVGVLGYRYDYSHYANFLDDLAVKETHRRRGVATALIKKFIAQSKKEQPRRQPYCLSSTDVTNKESIALHTKCGFKELGRLKKLHFGKDEIFFGYKVQK